MLETFGKNTVGSVLASFILSVFGAGVTLYTTFVMKERIRNIQLVAVEIVFSFVQLIVTYIYLIMKFLRIKSNYEVSLFPLAFAIIVLVFAFKKNPVDERPAASFLRALEREPHSIRSDSSLLILHLQPLEVCDLVYKYKIHILAVVSLVLDAISSVAPDQLSGQSKQSFVLATSLLLPVFGFACIKGRTERQHIGVVEVVFAMFQLIIITLVHFTLTISGATNNYNAPWFPLAFAAIVVFVFNKDEKNDPFKVIRQPRSRIVQRYIDLALLNSYEDLYKKVKQIYKIKGQLYGSESKWELTYITTRHEWRVVGSDEPSDWQQFRHQAEVMIIHRRQRQDDVKDDCDDRFDGDDDDYIDDVKDDSDDSFDGDNDDDDSGGVNDDDDGVKEEDDDDGGGGVNDDDDDGVKDDGGGGVNGDDDDGVKDDDNGVNDGGKKKQFRYLAKVMIIHRRQRQDDDDDIDDVNDDSDDSFDGDDEDDSGGCNRRPAPGAATADLTTLAAYTFKLTYDTVATTDGFLHALLQNVTDPGVKQVVTYCITSYDVSIPSVQSAITDLEAGASHFGDINNKLYPAWSNIHDCDRVVKIGPPPPGLPDRSTKATQFVDISSTISYLLPINT
ncbi:hypothetical protein LWI29_015364 [Acer saccharum]|uniref:PB1 domain-containing protein n=1 Tax=Acer saccharum TaxID=4024 RepID=A0AA39W181_ACESA|nr:hypothetical protein LWI29_015364 [Acer saccharum]